MFIKTLGNIQRYIRIVASVAIFLMMLFISINVIFRVAGNPLIGNVEIVRLMMVVIIIGGLAYCEFEKFHIAVELLYERFPVLIKKVLLTISYLIGAGITLITSYVYFKVAINTFSAGVKSTDLLQIPIYPFEFLIAIGFFIWFLQIIANMLTVREEEENGS